MWQQKKKKVCVVVVIVDCCFGFSHCLKTSKIANWHNVTPQNTKNNKTKVRTHLILLFLLYSYVSDLHLSYIYSFNIIFVNYYHLSLVFIIVIVFTIVFVVLRLVGCWTVHSVRSWHFFLSIVFVSCVLLRAPVLQFWIFHIPILGIGLRVVCS